MVRKLILVVVALLLPVSSFAEAGKRVMNPWKSSNILEYKNSSVYMMPVQWVSNLWVEDGNRKALEDKIAKAKMEFTIALMTILPEKNLHIQNEFGFVEYVKSSKTIHGIPDEQLSEFKKLHLETILRANEMSAKPWETIKDGDFKVNMDSQVLREQFKEKKLVMFVFVSASFRDPDYSPGGPLFHPVRPVHNAGDFASQVVGDALLDYAHDTSQPPPDKMHVHVSMLDAQSGDFVFNSDVSVSPSIPFTDPQVMHATAAMALLPLNVLDDDYKQPDPTRRTFGA